MFDANLVIVAQICDELYRRQAKFRRILSQIDIEGQCQCPPFWIPSESIPGCTFSANLVIVAQICDDLLCRQAKFSRILSQNGQNDLGGQSQNLHFQYQLKVSHNARLVQVWWF